MRCVMWAAVTDIWCIDYNMYKLRNYAQCFSFHTAAVVLYCNRVVCIYLLFQQQTDAFHFSDRKRAIHTLNENKLFIRFVLLFFTYLNVLCEF